MVVVVVLVEYNRIVAEMVVGYNRNVWWCWWWNTIELKRKWWWNIIEWYRGCLLHITCFKKSSHQVEVQESVDKTAKQFFLPGVS